jgi:hypothetical protein
MIEEQRETGSQFGVSRKKEAVTVKGRPPMTMFSP